MEIEWLEDSRIIFTDISRQDQNEYLDTLYQIGNGNENLAKYDLKERANELYASLKRQAARDIKK